MLILGLLGMYFDAVVVFVTSHSLLFRLAVTILCGRGACRNRRPRPLNGAIFVSISAKIQREALTCPPLAPTALLHNFATD